MPQGEGSTASSITPMDQHDVLHLVGGGSFMAEPGISSGGLETFGDDMTYRLSGPVEASGEYSISGNRVCVYSAKAVAARCFDVFQSGETILRVDPSGAHTEKGRNAKPMRPASPVDLEALWPSKGNTRE